MPNLRHEYELQKPLHHSRDVLRGMCELYCLSYMGVANGMSQYWLKNRLLSHCRALETLNRWNMQGAIFGHVSCLVVFAQGFFFV